MRSLSRLSTAVLGTAVPAVLAGFVALAPAALAAAPSSGTQSTSTSQSSSQSSTRSSAAPAGVTPHQWSRVQTLSKALQALRSCESGGRYTIDTGNGYYGAYQFLPSTWHSLGYRGMPNKASSAVQDAAAARLHDRRGSWADWGSCGRKAARVHA